MKNNRVKRFKIMKRLYPLWDADMTFFETRASLNANFGMRIFMTDPKQLDRSFTLYELKHETAVKIFRTSDSTARQLSTQICVFPSDIWEVRKRCSLNRTCEDEDAVVFSAAQEYKSIDDGSGFLNISLLELENFMWLKQQLESCSDQKANDLSYVSADSDRDRLMDALIEDHQRLISDLVSSDDICRDHEACDW